MNRPDARWSANPLSAIGVALTTVSAVLFLSLWLLDAAGWIRNPYVGLFAFVALPVLFVAGLLLIPMGAWRAQRRARRGLPAVPAWPRLDLNETRARRLALFVLLATLVNVLIIMAAGNQAVHYMDSPAFCGSVCHTPMQPQYVQWQRAPHAQIACVDCHVGTERGSFLKAKLAGTRRLVHVITGAYPRPIQAAPSTIPAPAFTCQQCHSTAAFSGDKLAVIRSYADDEANTESTTTLRLHIGMGSSGSKDEGRIHWHAEPGRTIEYAAADASETVIPWVRVTERDGRTRTYVAEGTDASVTPDATSRRRLDCLGCHSRPAHPFAPSAERVVDQAIADGRLDRRLPYIRRDTVSALKASHPPSAGVALELYREHVFPSMGVTWGTYVNQLGHTDAPGCFRCHDDGHKAADGTTIRQDCTLCHAMEQ